MKPKLRPQRPHRDSFRVAFIGIWRGLRTERNLRIHFGAGVLAAIAGVALGFSAVELSILTLTIVFVIALELVNTAFEATIDLISPNHHPLAGYVKDTAAGAVLVASIGAVIIAGLLFLPRLVHLVAG